MKKTTNATKNNETINAIEVVNNKHIKAIKPEITTDMTTVMLEIAVSTENARVFTKTVATIVELYPTCANIETITDIIETIRFDKLKLNKEKTEILLTQSKPNAKVFIAYFQAIDLTVFDYVLCNIYISQSVNMEMLTDEGKSEISVIQLKKQLTEITSTFGEKMNVTSKVIKYLQAVSCKYGNAKIAVDSSYKLNWEVINLILTNGEIKYSNNFKKVDTAK